MALYCAFQHFENDANTDFVKGCGRLLKPGDKIVILRQYLNYNLCSITVEQNSKNRQTIGFDKNAIYSSCIPSWHNSFSRHYSAPMMLARLMIPAKTLGLLPRIIRCLGWEKHRNSALASVDSCFRGCSKK